MSGGQIQKISDAGMKTWFRDNLQFEVSKYGIDLDSPEVQATGIFTDSTTSSFLQDLPWDMILSTREYW